MAHDEADMTDMVTVWIAMNDATEANGCLKVVPQGGGEGLLPHCAKLRPPSPTASSTRTGR